MFKQFRQLADILHFALKGTIEVDELWGDRSGVLHVARNQHWSFGDFNIYLPVNMMAYKLAHPHHLNKSD